MRGRKRSRLWISAIVVKGKLRDSMALRAVTRNAGVNYRIGRKCHVISRSRGVADIARLARWVWHMASRQHRGNPVGRGVTQTALVGSDLLSGGVIERPTLQQGIRCTHKEALAGLMAGDAT